LALIDRPRPCPAGRPHLPETAAPMDERAAQPRYQRTKAEPDGQTNSEQRQDIAGPSDRRAAVAHEQPYHTPTSRLRVPERPAIIARAPPEALFLAAPDHEPAVQSAGKVSWRATLVAPPPRGQGLRYRRYFLASQPGGRLVTDAQRGGRFRFVLGCSPWGYRAGSRAGDTSQKPTSHHSIGKISSPRAPPAEDRYTARRLTSRACSSVSETRGAQEGGSPHDM
jgi:hypothetical protein